MSRVKTFDSTGIAPGGVLFAGDLNAIQDQYADLVNLTQSVSVSVLSVGEAGLQLSRFTAGVLRISGQLRTDGVINSITGFQVNGVALASTHLSDSAALARLAGPTLTGIPLAPTAAQNTNTQQLATTAFVIGQAGGAIPAMDGAGASGVSTLFARSDHIHPVDTSRAPLASPGLTGAPTAPTAGVDTNTTQLATTQFVLGQVSAVAPISDAAAAVVGTSLRYARADHVHPARSAPTRQVFAGGAAYTTPAGCRAILVECLGGGGAGGTVQTGSTGSVIAVASGGQGGSYAAKMITNPAASYAISIGAGGGLSSGGATVFGANLVVGPGGSIGQSQPTGGGPPQWTSPAAIVAGAVGDVIAYGEYGTEGYGFGLAFGQYWGGAGGRGGGPFGGPGAAKSLGPGNNAPVGYGGGGGGACDTQFGGGPKNGGNGAGGYIVVTEYY